MADYKLCCVLPTLETVVTHFAIQYRQLHPHKCEAGWRSDKPLYIWNTNKAINDAFLACSRRMNMSCLSVLLQLWNFWTDMEFVQVGRGVYSENCQAKLIFVHIDLIGLYLMFKWVDIRLCRPASYKITFPSIYLNICAYITEKLFQMKLVQDVPLNV